MYVLRVCTLVLFILGLNSLVYQLEVLSFAPIVLLLYICRKSQNCHVHVIPYLVPYSRKLPREKMKVFPANTLRAWKSVYLFRYICGQLLASLPAADYVCDVSTDSSLPKPEGQLSKVMASSSITAANREGKKAR